MISNLTTTDLYTISGGKCTCISVEIKQHTDTNKLNKCILWCCVKNSGTAWTFLDSKTSKESKGDCIVNNATTVESNLVVVNESAPEIVRNTIYVSKNILNYK